MSQRFNPPCERSRARRLSGYFALLATLLLTLAAQCTHAQTACSVVYAISPQNSGAFGGSITISNTGTTAWTSWTLTWTFANGQTISSFWNGVETQSGANVTVSSETYNGRVAAGGSTSGLGFNGTWNGATNAIPTSFAINGNTCGSTTTGSFALAPSAAALSVTQGSSATDTISVVDVSPFTGSVTLTASGLPSGVTAAFGTNPATGSSVLSLTASSTATVGTSTISITGTSGSLIETTAVALTIAAKAPPSFTLAPSASTVSVAQGSSATDTITVADVGGFTGSVALVASGLPSGVTAAFGTNPTIGSSVLTLKASSTAASGTATLTITGTSGSLTATTSVNLVVGGCDTEGLFLAPSSATLSVIQGGAATDTITVSEFCFSSSATLAASGLPSGVTASFSTNPTTGSSILTLTASASATVGAATVTITGTSGTLTASTSIAVTVSAKPTPSFTLAPSAPAVSIAEGLSAPNTITVTDLNGFAGNIALAASGLPTGVTATFATNPATATSALTLAASSTATVGTVTVTITGTSGSLTASTTITLTVTPAASSSACSIVYTILPQNSTAFGGAITINNTGTTAWTSWTLTWTFTNGQTISSVWNASEIQSGAKVTLANLSYNGSIPAGGSITGIGFDGVWNGVTNAVPASFAINGSACGVATTPSFAIASSAPSLSIAQGSSATDTITVTDVNGFAGSVTLAASRLNGLPGGVTAAFAPNPTTGTSVLTLTASSSAVAGSYTINITGTSSALTASASVGLTVNTAGSFTLAPSPATLQILPGSTATDTIAITDVSPFNGNVLFTASGLPSGVTAAFNTNSATVTGVLTLTAASTATAGTYNITITGTSGTLVETTTVALTVAASPLQIVWVSPAAGIASSSMTIMPSGIGMSVGSSQGTGQVYFGTTAATVTAWVDDAIVVTVPSLAAGSYNVTVATGGVTSNPLPFTITATAPNPAMYTGNSTWFSSLGQPYGGCGVPQANLDTQNFVALNVQNDPGIYDDYLSRPITGAGLAEIGFFDNGANCGRYVHVTIGDFCTGINNGAADFPFCQGADGWVTDQFTGAELDMVVADSCQDGNAWCRDDAYHLDLAQPSLNLFELNGVPVGDMFPNSWQNRQIDWYFEEAPLYTGDINIGFITSASATWGAISITHLQNGIHGVNYYSNGAWVAAVMDGDLGEDYVISPTVAGGALYEIQVLDITNQPINDGRIYSFSFPASCPVDACLPPFTQVTYTTSQPATTTTPAAVTNAN
jgi:cellulose binding protein with CBM2 domain/IPT/TIG domain-containing protein